MYTNQGELSDETCSVKVKIDMTRFKEMCDAERVMSEAVFMAKESVNNYLNSLSSDITKITKQQDALIDYALTNQPDTKKPANKPSAENDIGFNFRDRIPNNVIDIKDITIKQAVTENSLVRCPNCGQAHCIAISSGDCIYVMARDYTTNEYRIIANFDSLTNQNFIDMCFKEGNNYLSYFDAIREVEFKKDSDFAVDNDTEIFCPVCHTTNSFLHWKTAFENPLAHFETENLCDACGGERVEKFIGKRKCQECEKCGLAIPMKGEI